MHALLRRPLAASLVALAVVLPVAAAQAPSVEAPACARVSVSSRHDGVGFTHVLRVLNACAQPITCSVGLEGSPESFTVAAGGSEERTLAVASPVASPVVTGRCTPR